MDLREKEEQRKTHCTNYGTLLATSRLNQDIGNIAENIIRTLSSSNFWRIFSRALFSSSFSAFRNATILFEWNPISLRTSTNNSKNINWNNKWWQTVFFHCLLRCVLLQAVPSRFEFFPAIMIEVITKTMSKGLHEITDVAKLQIRT